MCIKGIGQNVQLWSVDGFYIVLWHGAADKFRSLHLAAERYNTLIRR